MFEVLDAPASIGDPVPYAVGFLVSLVVGLFSLRLLLTILRRYGLAPFVPYLVVVAGLALWLG